MPLAAPAFPPIKNVAIIGSGSIGASWAALFLAQGLNVTVFDINPATKSFLHKIVSSALPTLKALGLLKVPSASADDIVFSTDLKEALQNTDFVQENGPERLEFKQKLFTEIAGYVRDNVIISTSSSGLTCSSIQEGMPASARPERCVVGHPFNPPHLIPLVEVVGGEQTSRETIGHTLHFYRSVGKKAVYVQKEVPGHIANRLQAALFREVFYLVQNNVCTVKDIDEAMAGGPGLRWGVMGPSTLMHLAGGEGGIEHMANHLLQPLTTWWAKEDPVVGDELKKKWVAGTLDAINGRRYEDLTKQRDEQIVKILQERKNVAENEVKRLYILDTDLSQPGHPNGSIQSCNVDGSDLRTVIGNMAELPDGIIIDNKREFMYWTNMGTSLSSNSGSISRARLDGSNQETIIPAGTPGVHTPKQITLAHRSQKLYWCDREGMKVCRSNLDGSNIEILLDTSSEEVAHPHMRWCVGITVDEERGFFYWTQKGYTKAKLGRIFRARIDAPAERELLFENLPEPIDLELEEASNTLYWTDRGDPPTGNSLNRAKLGVAKTEVEILATRLHETIGLALDKERGMCYVTDLAGGVYAIDVEKKQKKVLFPELGDLTGIALA